MSAILVFVASVVLVALINLWRTQSPRYLSPLRRLRGPRAQNLLFGNFNQLSAPYQALVREWVNEYGPNIKVHGVFNVCRTYHPRVLTTPVRSELPSLLRPLLCSPPTRRQSSIFWRIRRISASPGIPFAFSRSCLGQVRSFGPIF